MIRAALALLALASALSAAPQGAADAWLKSWRRGELDLLHAGPDDAAGRIHARTEPLDQRQLRLLVEMLVEEQSATAARTLLRLAAVGLDGKRYATAQAPQLVRRLAESGLARLIDAAARRQLVAAAAGDRGVLAAWPRGERPAIQAAALQALAALPPTDAGIAALVRGLGTGDARLRLAAARALQSLRLAAAAPALTAAVTAETDPVVLGHAITALCAAVLADNDDEEVREAAGRAVVGAIGRTDPRADLAALDYVDALPTHAAIPVLIDLLRRAAADPAGMSGVLRHRAHEVLVDITGASFALDQPEDWQRLWDQEGDGLDLTPRGAREAAAERGRTVSSGFFGIPVRGTRVAFVVDLSGSMKFPMTGGQTRLERAVEELTKAAGRLPPHAEFQLITFDGRPDARLWTKKPVRATPGNIARFGRDLRRLRPGGATNTWAGLDLALRLDAFRHGAHDLDIDELFLLSDGVPSVGAVVDAEEILGFVAAANAFARVRIHTVYIGGSTTADDRAAAGWAGMTGPEFMRRLAAENGGVAVEL